MRATARMRCVSVSGRCVSISVREASNNGSFKFKPAQMLPASRSTMQHAV